MSKNTTARAINETEDVLYESLSVRDPVTGKHSKNVAVYVKMLATEMRREPREIQEMYNAALLHDIGKLGIADTLLKSSNKLNTEQFIQVQEHVKIGRNLLANLGFSQIILDGVYYHHERFDGQGYLHKLAGENIPLVARILAIADTFDALTSERPYRKPLSPWAALDKMSRFEGQFDPSILKIFLSLESRLICYYFNSEGYKTHKYRRL